MKPLSLDEILNEVFLIGVEVGKVNNDEISTTNESIAPNEAKQAIIDWALSCVPEEKTTHGHPSNVVADAKLRGWNAAIKKMRKNLTGEDK